jgi:hypothetical protein
MLRRGMLCGALLGLLSVTLVFSGCGRKGDPVPPRLSLPPAVTGLSAESSAAGVLLTWEVSGPVERIDHFRIQRSEAPAEGACPGCPQDYRPLETVKLNAPGLQRRGEKGFGLADGTVSAGRYYSWRVSACDGRGRCAEPSAPAGLFKR